MKKVLIIGDRCTDIFIYGECKRLSPEAPIPVLTPINTISNDGMAGNVVANFKALSKEHKVESIHQTRKITKTRYVDQKSNYMFIRVDEGEERVVPLKFTGDILNRIQKADAVIVSDYNKGFLTEEVLRRIGSNAKFAVLDTKKRLDTATIELYDFVKLNEGEFKNNKTASLSALDKIIVTLGSRGAMYQNKIYPSPAPKETIDVSGAGDTFLAAFTYKYLKTKSVEQSICFANEKAAAVVSKKGVAVP